jgi:hypothetical protein
MARKRKSHTKKHHRRRRRSVGALDIHHSSPLVVLGSMAAGYFLGDTVTPMLTSILPTSLLPAAPATATTGFSALFAFNARTIPTFLEGGIGAALLLSKKKSIAKSVAGGFLSGLAVQNALKTAGMVTGYQAVPVVGRRGIRGYQSVPVIGGTPAQLQGVPPQLQGFRVNGYTPQGSGVMGRMNGLYDRQGLYGCGSGSGVTTDPGSEMMN